MTHPTKKPREEAADKSKNSRILFSILAGRNAHIITLIIIGHLLIEYHLDQIISTKVKVKSKKSSLKKNFSEKLKVLYPIWLPLSIYKNIKLLNNARNYVAHNLGVIDHEPIIYTSSREKRVVAIPKKKNKEKTYFRELINSVLFELVNYSSDSLGVSAEPNLEKIFRTIKK